MVNQLTLGSWDAILVPIITDKLDQKLKREYETFYIQEIEKDPNDSSSPKIDTLLKIIYNRCELLERLDKDEYETLKPNFKNTRHEYKSILSSHISTEATSCYLCKQNHTIYKCNKFLKLNVFDRIETIIRMKNCLNCLMPHELPICKASKCRKCNKSR